VPSESTAPSWLKHVASRGGLSGVIKQVEQIGGATTNQLWRVADRRRSVVVKHAPPLPNSDSGLALDPRRVFFEAAALSMFSDGEPLAELVSTELRPPRLLHVDAHQHALVLEDVGTGPNLASALADGDPSELLGRIGRFIAGLHRLGTAERFSSHDNRAIQASRIETLYSAVAEHVAGQDDAEALSAAAEELGMTLMSPGACLTMGDLVPSAIVVSDEGMRILGWELSHFGRAGQDIGGLWAHLRRLELERGVERGLYTKVWMASYAAGGNDAFANPEERDITRVHAACELQALGQVDEGIMLLRGTIDLD